MTFRYGGKAHTSMTNRILSTLLAGATLLTSLVFYGDLFSTPSEAVDESGFSIVSSYNVSSLNPEPVAPTLSNTGSAVIGLTFDPTTQAYMLFDEADFITLAAYSYSNDTDDMTFTVSSEVPITLTSAFSGIGSAAHPFAGIINSIYPTTLVPTSTTAVFRYLSSAASLFETGNNITISSTSSFGGLAQVLVADNTSMTLSDKIYVGGTVLNVIPSSVDSGYLSNAGMLFGSIIMGSGISSFSLSALATSINLTGTAVTASGTGDAGLIVGRTYGNVTIDLTPFNLSTLSCAVTSNRSDAGGLVGSCDYDLEFLCTSPFTSTLTGAVTAYGGNSGTLVGNISAGATLSLTDKTTSAAADLEITTVGGSVNAYRHRSGNIDNGGSAGTLIGNMETGTDLTAGDVTLTSVVINAGRGAGGAVGSLTDASVSCDTIDIASGVVGGGSYSGGYIGLYDSENTAQTEIILADNTVTVGSTSPVEIAPAYSTIDGDIGFSETYTTGGGGLFGRLILNDDTPEYKIDYSTQSVQCIDAIYTTTSANSYSVSIGGAVGIYTSDDIMNTLAFTGFPSGTIGFVKSALTSPSVQKMYTYGGVVGLIGEGSFCSFLNICETSSTGSASSMMSRYFGGFVGYALDGAMIDNENSRVNSGYISILNDATMSAFLGALGEGGVLRLSGSFILTNNTYTQTGSSQAGDNFGQVVGRQENSLIFCENGWNITRASNSSGYITDDIGNYGAVIKNGTLGNFITISAARTVTFASTLAAGGSTVTIASLQNFAALAITISTRGIFSAVSGITSYSELLSKTIELSADIDLTGAGIESLTRSDSTDDTFTGMFDGNGNTLTIATGERYNPAASNTGAGGIVDHRYVGLFCAANNATFTDLTLSGEITCEYSGSVGTINDASVYAGGLAARASGTVTVTNVTTEIDVHEKKTSSDKNNPVTCYYGGIFAYYTGSSLEISSSTGNASFVVSNLDFSYTGGLVAYISTDGGGVLDFSDDTLTVNITSGPNYSHDNLYIGGLVSMINTGVDNFSSTKIASVDLTGLTVNAASSITARAEVAAGGLLGYQWKFVEVEMSGSVNGSVNITTGGNFGGLVYWISGRMILDSATTIQGTFTGASTRQDVSDGGVVCNGKNFYLVVRNGASVTPTVTNGTVNRADLLVGNNIVTSNSGGAERGGIVTIETGSANPGYMPSTSSWYSLQKNPNTRYYFNVEMLDKDHGAAYRTRVLDNRQLSNTGDVLLWHILNYTSVSASAAPAYYFRLTQSFSASRTYSFTADIDMSGLCIYPTTINGGTYNFADHTLSFDSVPLSNVSITDTLSQEYMMQTGLFFNVTGTLNVNDAVLSGTVSHWAGGSGALITGTISGSYTDENHYTIIGLNINGLELNNLAVEDIATLGYAPLLINKIYQCVDGDIEGVTQDYGNFAAGVKAGTSLIGDAGDDDATFLNIFFKNIILDGKETTTRFKSSSLFHSVTYLAGHSSFIYNFYISEDWPSSANHIQQVTYGEELTENSTEYYDAGLTLKVNSDNYPTNTVRNYSDYIPYVLTGTQIDVNKKSGDLLEGWGTYQHPYIIDSPRQFFAVFQFISDPTRVQSGWQVNYPDGANDTARHISTTYTTLSNSDADFPTAAVRAWLQQAYYQLDGDIDLSSETSYFGFGTEDYPFYGVIIGTKDSRRHTVTMPTSANIGNTNIGSLGLVNIAYGCVVKDVDIEYSGTYTVSSVASSYFGGAIGQVNGGDNIIDGVSVTGLSSTGNGIKLSDRVNYAGGYVGFIKAGGVVFRNMEDSAGASTYKPNGTAVGDDYYYANPYVGRVLDGYAITELYSGQNYSINNTDRNYTINSFSGTVAQSELIDVTLASSRYTIGIADARELFLYAAALNSGSLSVGTDTAYKGSLGSKVRVSGYSSVGSLTSTDDYTRALVDNAAITSTSKPYLVEKYFSQRAVASTKTTVSLTEGTYDLRDYGNGFHGLGGRYDTSDVRVSPVVSFSDNGSTPAFNGNGSTVLFSMNVRQYVSVTTSGTTTTVTPEVYAARYVGFINMLKNSGASNLNDLTIKGTSSLTHFNVNTGVEITTPNSGSTNPVTNFSTLYCAGGFIGYASSSSSGNIFINDIAADSLTVCGATAAATVIAVTSKATTLTDCYYKDSVIKGKVYVGGLVGVNSAALNIYSTADITMSDSAIVNEAKTITRADGVGGLIGTNRSALIIGQASAKIIMENVMVLQKYDTSTVNRFGAGGAVGMVRANCTVTNLHITDIYVLGSQTTETNLNNQTGLATYKNYYGITDAKFGEYADRFAAFLKYALYYQNRNGADADYDNNYIGGGAGGVIGAGYDLQATSYILTLDTVTVSSSAGAATVILSGNNSGGLIGDYRSSNKVTPVSVVACSFNATGSDAGAGKALVFGGARAAGVLAYNNSTPPITMNGITVGNDKNVTQLVATMQGSNNANDTAGLLAWAPTQTTITGCTVKNCMLSSLISGGLVAYATANITVTDSTVDNCSILCTTAGGGLVASTTAQTFFADATVSNSFICGNRMNGSTEAYAGGLVGISSKNIYGNSILSDENSIGYTPVNYSVSSNLNNSIAGTAFTMTGHTRSGAWVGNITSTSANLTILGAARNDADEISYPAYAQGSPRTSSIVYEDYLATASDTIKTMPSITPSPGITFTGDAVEYGTPARIRSDISWWANTDATVTATDNYFKKYLNYDTTTPNTTLADMQLYFLDTDVDTSIRNYVNLLTNGGFSDWTDAGLQISSNSKTYSVTSGGVVSDSGLASGSVVYNVTDKVFENGGQYDLLADGGGTFTVLTLTFTNSSNTADNTPYSINIPIYYPQVLEVQTRIIPIDYEEYAIPEFRNQTTASINISTGGTFSLYLEYIYNDVRLSDEGWNFDKQISSKSDTGQSIGAGIYDFPEGSVIKLVDLNSADSSGYKTYYYTLPAASRTISIEAIEAASGVTTGLTPLADLPSLDDYAHMPAVLDEGANTADYGLERYVVVVELPQTQGGNNQGEMIYHLYPDIVLSHNVTLLYTVPPAEARVSVWSTPIIAPTLSADDEHDDINLLEPVEAAFSVDITFPANYVYTMSQSGKERFGVMELYLKEEGGDNVHIPAGTVVTITDSAGNVVMDEMLQQSVFSVKYTVDGNLLNPNLVYPLEYDISFDFSEVDTDLFNTNFNEVRYTLYNDFYMTSNVNYPQSGIGGTSSITLSHTNLYLAGIVVNANENMLDLGINNYPTEESENSGIIDFNIFVELSHCSEIQLQTMRLPTSTTKLTFVLLKKGLNDVYSPVNPTDYINYINYDGAALTNMIYPIILGNDTQLSIPFTVSFKTGAVTDYANFKLMATLTSVDAASAEIIPSASDHFCCTLAKIYTKII